LSPFRVPLTLLTCFPSQIGLDVAVRVRFKFGEACCRKNLVVMRLLKKKERGEECLREVTRALRLFRALKVPEGEGRRGSASSWRMDD
jgi:hypothetical protein